jgi:hypothetical protein
MGNFVVLQACVQLIPHVVQQSGGLAVLQLMVGALLQLTDAQIRTIIGKLEVDKRSNFITVLERAQQVLNSMPMLKPEVAKAKDDLRRLYGMLTGRQALTPRQTPALPQAASRQTGVAFPTGADGAAMTHHAEQYMMQHGGSDNDSKAVAAGQLLSGLIPLLSTPATRIAALQALFWLDGAIASMPTAIERVLIATFDAQTLCSLVAALEPHIAKRQGLYLAETAAGIVLSDSWWKQNSANLSRAQAAMLMAFFPEMTKIYPNWRRFENAVARVSSLF